MIELELRAHAEGTILPVRALPGAKRNALLGAHAGALKVAVTAPPERGKANQAIAELLAEALGCNSSRIALLSGPTRRAKRFLIQGLPPELIRERLDAV